MMKPNEKFRLGEHLPFIGSLFGLGFWLADILIDALLFGEGTVSQQLLHPEPMEVYFRLMVGGLFILFGIYAGRLVKKQQQLKMENQLKAEMLDRISESVMVHDREGNFIYLNGAACAMRGYNHNEMMKLNLSLLNLPDSRPKIKANVEEIFRLGGKTFEVVNIKKDGSLITLEVNAVKFKNAGRDVVLSIARDISLRHEHEQTRDRLLKELQTAMVKIKTLNGMIPICSNCKKLRNDDGYWQQLEEYLHQHTDADFSYGLCDQCSAELYPEFSGPGKN